MADNNPQRFSSGLEIANLIATSDLLDHSWKAITKLRTVITADESTCLAFFGHYNERSNCKILAFVTTPNCSENPLEEEGGEDLVSLSDLKDEFTAFEFLYSESCPDSAINGVALDLFGRFYPVYEQEISRLKSNPKTQLIITGHGLGGSVASLFTLLLLDSIDLTKAKRPLCITFGSPLLGNKALQSAISQFSTWSSCFLHVVSNHDPLPTSLLNNKAYYPFGTFLFCSESGGCSCFEDPKSTSKLLEATKANTHLTAFSFFDYKETILRLIDQANLKATTRLITENSESWTASFIAQLEAIGVVPDQAQQQQQRAVDVKRLAMALQGNEMNMIFEKTNPFAKTLNDVKINMAKLEWYKKKCNSESIGYYDSYKNGRTEPDIKVAEFKKILLVYWENKVEEAERKPVKEGSPLNVRLLFGGTNYRRMVEPLDIAEHYRKGLKNYKAHRPKHYRKLEEWYNESMTPESSSTQRESVSSILTVDSLFWAHVEEAVVACQVLRMVDSSAEEKEAELAKLKEFEEYVVELMKNYGVSSEIFLPHSSFMRWWDEYDGIVGDDHDSVLTMLMRNEEYKEYANGRLDIP
ncbi:senescence-associated carboxylesterase 101 isoform X1 [Cucurbita pepo subsp. pepo]|uniref:senescence-associated carboxylesterase 101 isoform X1 n=1 Tax=Cucurbita pepo subsp. pepo TaxID=3664 RepID=UPI000C9D99BE|nr:senescence-associated carboxylesterase 101 isoform X1 [Cucurbita pepo subsp. pepo]